MRKGLVHSHTKRKMGNNVIEYEGTSKSKYKKHKSFEDFGDDELCKYFTSDLSVLPIHKPPTKRVGRS